MIEGVLGLLASAIRFGNGSHATPAPLPEALFGFALFPGAVLRGTRYGVTFAGIHDGACWSATMNYQPPEAHGGLTNIIVSGRWQFTSLGGAATRGALLGEVIAGQIARSADGQTAEITALVRITRGVRGYRAAVGTTLLIQGHADHAPPWPSFRGSIVPAPASVAEPPTQPTAN